ATARTCGTLAISRAGSQRTSRCDTAPNVTTVPHGAGAARGTRFATAARHTPRESFAMRRLFPLFLLLVVAVPQACHRDEVTAPRMSAATGGADPSTSRIVFVSTRDGDREIYVMASDGSAQTRLTNVPEWDYEPSWSPDGNRIGFVSQRGRSDRLYVMAPDGSAVTTLTRHDSWWGDRRPSWAPDGQTIVF